MPPLWVHRLVSNQSQTEQLSRSKYLPSFRKYSIVSGAGTEIEYLCTVSDFAQSDIPVLYTSSCITLGANQPFRVHPLPTRCLPL